MTRLRWSLVPILFSVAGCTGLLHSTAPALQLYMLQAPGGTGADAGAAPASQPGAIGARPTLRVARPLTAPGLNTDRIALLRPGSRLDYYAGSRWSAPLADVVFDLQLSVLRADPAWSAVVDERSTFNADYLLQTSIDRFAAEYASQAGPPQVTVALQCLLIRRSDGALLGSFAVAASQPARENHMASVIEAFSAAADRALVAAATQSGQLLRTVKSPPAP